jgi:predicted nucleotidyltransferase component of viral defense system
MLSRDNLERFTKLQQTSVQNVVREYCQHLFLSFFYQNPGSEKLLFKGGTALRIILKSPRFSEDLDFTGVGITHQEIEELFTDTLADIEKTGMTVHVTEATKTTGGYLGIAVFEAYGMTINVQIEVSLRKGKGSPKKTRALITSDYIPAYTLVHLSLDDIILGKIEALVARHKPRDFYDYFFLLSGNYPAARTKENLKKVLKLLRQENTNFQAELKKFLPASQAMHLRDFKKILGQKIMTYL